MSFSDTVGTMESVSMGLVAADGPNDTTMKPMRIFNPKKILVAGCLGFIASHFVKQLAFQPPTNGMKIVGVSRNTDQKNAKRLEYLLTDPASFPHFKMVFQDLNDANFSELLEDVDVVVNFAAKTFVDYSVRDVQPFFDSNVMGTYHLLEAVRKNSNIKLFVQVSCYDKLTRALTTGGLKRYDQIKAGDKVLSLNVDSGKIEEKVVEKVICQEYDGKMVQLKNKRIDFLVTPNHRMLLKQKASKKLFFEEAEKASLRSIAYLPTGEWDALVTEKINIAGVGDIPVNDLMYFIGVFVGDGFTGYQEKKTENKSGLTRQEFISRKNKKGQFIDGRNGDITETISKSWRVFLAVPPEKHSRGRVESVLKRLGIRYGTKKEGHRNNGAFIYFSSKHWMQFLEQFGKGAKNKHLPRWVLNLDKGCLSALFDGLMDTDGAKNRKSYYTSSEKLLCDFCELCFKLGKHPSFKYRETESNYKGRAIKGSGYTILIGETDKSFGASASNVQKYKGTIWCLKVDGNKNFIVERNGRLDFCGNTDEVYGALPDENPGWKEDATLNPTNPYSATKAAADMLCIGYAHTYKIPILITRTENNYGFFQHPQKVIPTWVRKALANEPLPIYGDGKQKRMWLRVEDHVDALWFLIQRSQTGIYNIAGGHELENIQLADFILGSMQKPKTLIQHIDDSAIRPNHDRRYGLNTEKINALGWNPKWDMFGGISNAVAWYVQNQWWMI
jgi:dTDP-D-glucose 4,6-dehydratase/intein/homing endonuclease